MNKTYSFVIGLLVSIFSIQSAIPKGFVYLHDVDPTIIQSIRYATAENFLGCPVVGYNSDSKVVMTKKAALALAVVQKEVAKDGYELVVYDAYRPQKAVDHFVYWGKDISDQKKKKEYYPYLEKKDVFALKYVAAKSGHSRGSTVDLTLIKKGNKVKPVEISERILSDGRKVLYLDDGTVDMGTSFDFLDKASHGTSNLVSPEIQKMRNCLKRKMSAFKVSEREWWHFTLISEPFPTTYFDFEFESGIK